MRRTANMSYEDFARFVIEVSEDPTEGLVLDAVKSIGANDDEAAQALEATQAFINSTGVDSVEDTGKVIEEGSDPDENGDESGKTLGDLASDADNLTGPDAEDQGVLIPKDDPSPRNIDEFEKEPGEVLDDEKVEDATRHPGNDVELSGTEIMSEISAFIQDNPAATDEDLKRHLFGMGIPGDKLKKFMDGFELLRTSQRLANMIFSNVPASEAARWAIENNPNLDTDALRAALREAGIPSREIDDAIEGLPPRQVEDPMGGDPGMEGGPEGMGGPGDMGGPGGPPMDGPVDGGTEPVEDPTFDPEGGEGEPPPMPADDPMVATAQQFVAQNPDITPEELMDYLQSEGGATPEAAQAAAESVLGQDPAAQDRVMTPRGAARVAHVYDSFDGDIYMVNLDEGGTAYFGREALSAYKTAWEGRDYPGREFAKEETCPYCGTAYDKEPGKACPNCGKMESKTSSSNIFKRIQAHVEENWYTEMDRLPRALKGAYEERVAKTTALRADIREAIKTAAPDVQVELLHYDDLLENEEEYCHDKIKNSFNLEEAEYLTSRPQFGITASHAGQEIGPSGGVLHMAALAAEAEVASIDWKHEVTAGADLFVEDFDVKYIADAGEVRKRAAAHIKAKTAGLSTDESRPLINQFMANVERARKQAAIEARKNGTPKEASVELPDNFEKGLFY